MNQIKS